MNLVLLGAPGAGKGTQAERLADRFGLRVVSTGNLLRAAMRDQTALGQKAKAFMDAGALVPDDLILALVRETASDGGVLFDGFPRTLAQAQALSAMLPVLALSIDVPDARIVSRMGGRRVCKQCQHPYHLEFQPPKTEGVCDLCGGTLVSRPDDAPEVVRSRLEIYHQQTEPVKDFYRAQGTLCEVDGDRPVDTVQQALRDAVEAFHG